MTGNDKIKEPFIRYYKEYNTDTRVHLEVSFSEENMKISLQEGLLRKFKLTTTISTSNMHLFGSKGSIINMRPLRKFWGTSIISILNSMER